MKKRTAKRIADAFAECVVHRVDAIVQPFREVIDGVATDARTQTEALHQRIDDLLEQERQRVNVRFDLANADERSERKRVDDRIDFAIKEARRELGFVASSQSETIGQAVARLSAAEASHAQLLERVELLERARRAS